MKLQPQVSWERGDTGPGYLFDRRGGGIYGLNATSALVLEGLEEGRDEDGLVALLIARGEVGELAARDDVRAFLFLLAEQGLVAS
ncbi:MAG: PqqD family protein [Planctomycetota bacterium]|nr:PqqD family protein [Planctomycetota bacterium]MDP6761476.1 PqqD family protein [Planctomycetota bacterium]MDP6989438.1 PqqD family protein [Planctomycetota bacterium]